MKEKIIQVVTILLALVVMIVAVWMMVASPVTVLRVIRYGDTTIDDFTHYPVRDLTASDDPAPFAEDVGAGRVPNQIEWEGGEPAALEDLIAGNDTIAFIVIKDDTILFEQYYQGHTQSSLSQAFSVSKSVTSALIGAAINDGYIESAKQLVTDFIPELANDGFDDVRIEHLLTMTSGSDYRENDNPFGIHVILNYTPRLRERILSFDAPDPPGEDWRYKSGDNALLALILERVLAPQTITDYSQAVLWTPLGMEYDGMWSLDHAGTGLEKTWCCLAAAARDLAKIGRLYLQEGSWEEHRVFSQEWALQSTATGAVRQELWPDGYEAIGLWNYGYQWWLASQEAGDFMATGKDGQYIYVNPTENVIIVRLGWSSGDMTWGQWITLFQTLAYNSK